jgi:hypothetical protein
VEWSHCHCCSQRCRYEELFGLWLLTHEPSAKNSKLFPECSVASPDRPQSVERLRQRLSRQLPRSQEPGRRGPVGNAVCHDVWAMHRSRDSKETGASQRASGLAVSVLVPRGIKMQWPLSVPEPLGSVGTEIPPLLEQSEQAGQVTPELISQAPASATLPVRICMQLLSMSE